MIVSAKHSIPFLEYGFNIDKFPSIWKSTQTKGKLNRWKGSSAIGTEASFRSLLLILLGPVAFYTFKPLRTLYTSMADTTF